MKGIIFTEFLEMVESRFSLDMVDDILEDCELASGGIYTSVGSYHHGEMVSLVTALSRHSGLPLPVLLKAFGEYLFGQFFKGYPHFFEKPQNALEFMAGIENIIHAEVLKLYPDAELPKFIIEVQELDLLVMVYQSARHFEDVAEGLIEGCIKHYGEHIQIARQTVDTETLSGERFTLRRVGVNYG